MSLGPANEAARLQALRDYNILDTEPVRELDELVEVASMTLRAPMVAIALMDSDRQWFKAKLGLPMDETPRSMSFCRYMLNNPTGQFVVEDASQDTRFADHPMVTSGPGIRFYVGTPLLSECGHMIGSLCVLDTKPRTATSTDLRVLELLARNAVDYMNNEKLKDQQKAELEFVTQKMQRLADQAPAALYQFAIQPSGEPHFNFLSRGIQDLHPELSPDAIKADPELFFRKVHPEDEGKLRSAIIKSFRDLEIWRSEFRLVQPDGSIRWCMAASQPERGPNGSVIWSGAVQDMTPQKDYQNVLEQISFDISHVLRKPVTNMLGLTSLLDTMEIDQDTLKTYSQHIQIVSREMEQFTRDLMDTYYEKQLLASDNYPLRDSA